MKTLVVGTRGSALALWQARWIAARLEEAGREVRLEIIKTAGDRFADAELQKIGAAAGNKGVFTKEIEDALLDGRVDVAVHSLKDLPTELPAGLALGAIPAREDPRDALVGKRLAELRDGTRVGTSSLRRAAQLKALRPALRIEEIRGNVDTRLRKLDEGRYEAIVLAAAGLRRLGLEGRIDDTLEPETITPAPGQGALGVEIRADDEEMRRLLAPLDDEPTRRAVEAERALLAALGGGCQIPLGAYADISGGRLRLRAAAAAADGSKLLRVEEAGAPSEAAALGRRAAGRLQELGVAALLPA